MTLGKRMWCVDCRHFCPTECGSSCAINGHGYEWAKPAGPTLFARVVRIVSQVADAEEAALLSREAALQARIRCHADLDRGAASGRAAAAAIAREEVKR
jgi:hypothetical protein